MGHENFHPEQYLRTDGRPLFLPAEEFINRNRAKSDHNFGLKDVFPLKRRGVFSFLRRKTVKISESPTPDFSLSRFDDTMGDLQPGVPGRSISEALASRFSSPSHSPLIELPE